MGEHGRIRTNTTRKKDRARRRKRKERKKNSQRRKREPKRKTQGGANTGRTRANPDKHGQTRTNTDKHGGKEKKKKKKRTDSWRKVCQRGGHLSDMSSTSCPCPCLCPLGFLFFIIVIQDHCGSFRLQLLRPVVRLRSLLFLIELGHFLEGEKGKKAIQSHRKTGTRTHTQTHRHTGSILPRSSG